MPKASSKRVAQETKTPTAKKPRVNPMLKAMEESLSQADFLSEPCRKMLLSILPSLDVPADERCEVAKAAVRMFGEMLETLTLRFEESARAAQANVGGLEAAKRELAAAVTRAETAAADAGSAVAQHETALVQAAGRLVEAKAALAAKQEAQQSSSTVLAQRKNAQATLTEGIDVHLKAITEGEDGAVHFQAIQPILRDIGIDESLLAALPSICAKPAPDRMPFDKLAVEELQKKMQAKADQLVAEVEHCSSEAEAHAAAVEGAQGELTVAEGARGSVQEALAAARESRQAAEVALQSARAAVDGQEPKCQQARVERDARAQELETHRAYTLSLFESLRDRTSPKQAKEAAMAVDQTAEPEARPEEREPAPQEPKVPEGPSLEAVELCAGAGGA